MYKYKRNGFTLVELMAVIIIISLIALLTFPNIINQIKKTKKSNNKMIEDVVIEQAKKYVSDNEDEFQDDEYFIKIEDLIDNGYVKEELIKASSNDIKEKYILYTDDKYSLIDKLYTQLEYIDSTGTQYIDTNIYPDNNTVVKFKIILYSVQISVFGSRWSGSPKYDTYGMFVSRSTGKTALYYGRYSNNEYKFIKNFTNKEMSFEYNIHNIKYNDTVIDIERSNFKSSYSIYIFSMNNEGIVSYQEMGDVRLYYFQIYDNDKLVRDYIPVLDYNGVACLYDKVEGKFYYNQGTGEFLYG